MEGIEGERKKSLWGGAGVTLIISADRGRMTSSLRLAWTMTSYLNKTRREDFTMHSERQG